MFNKHRQAGLAQIVARRTHEGQYRRGINLYAPTGVYHHVYDYIADVTPDDGTAVFRATFTALGLGIEGAVPVELKKGNGTGKFSQAALFSLIPAGLGRSVELNGVEIWGPLGAGNVAACTAVVTAGYSVVANDPSCRGGTKIGVAGISIP